MKYLLSMYVCLSSLFGYVGVDGLFVGLCLHLSSHYKIIAKQVFELNQFFTAHSSGSKESPKDHLQCNSRESEEIQAAIVAIINRHVDVLNLTTKVSKIFRYIVFVHFFAAAIVIGMTSINFLLVSGCGWFRSPTEYNINLIKPDCRLIGQRNCCTSTICWAHSFTRTCMRSLGHIYTIR